MVFAILPFIFLAVFASAPTIAEAQPAAPPSFSNSTDGLQTLVCLSDSFLPFPWFLPLPVAGSTLRLCRDPSLRSGLKLRALGRSAFDCRLELELLLKAKGLGQLLIFHRG